MTSILTQIWNGAVKDFDTAEAWINTTIQRIEAVFPAASPTIAAIASDLKQAASDAIGDVDTALNTVAPTLTKTVEAAADAALTTYTGGAALPLVGLTNDAIERIEALAVTTANSWALQAKAALAENVAAAQTATHSPTPAVPAQ